MRSIAFFRQTHAVVLTAALTGACAADMEPSENLGVATAAIAIVPSGVRCVEITVTGANTVTQRRTVTPGVSATIALGGLPVGDVIFTGAAYGFDCNNPPTAGAAGYAMYVALPSPATLVQGITSMVALSLRRSAGATVTVDFNDRVGAKCPTTQVADCDGNPANGCEVDLTSSVANCSACGLACTVPNASAACISSVCTMGECNPGFANCDGRSGNGCEANLQSDTISCGACGVRCAYPNAGPICTAGVCSMGTCIPGFANCDGVAANGCEVNLLDGANCGACGRVCPNSNVCRYVDSSRVYVCELNDTPGRASRIDLTRGPSIDLPFDTSYAQPTQRTCAGVSSPDVFFRFTLTQREAVYVDSFGSTLALALGFGKFDTTSDSLLTWNSSPAACNAGGRCTTTGSRIAAILNPGTHYLSVASATATATRGTGTLHFQHLPVGNGALTALTIPETSTCYRASFSGSTAGSSETGALPSTCSDGAAPENSYWWTTCPSSPEDARVMADTCGGGDFNTVVSYTGARGGSACVSSAGTPGLSCGDGRGAYFNTPLRAGAGLHVLTVDGRDGEFGSYNLSVAIGNSCL